MKRGRELTVLLEGHNRALAACTACGLDPDVRPIISDARAPRIMLVGQAPGRMETTSRRAFSGRAGRTLFRWLERAGLAEKAARRHLHFAAITRCYPGPGPTGRGDRVPSPRERELCSGWLDAELRIIRPRLVIPVGRLAIDRFIGSLPLDQVIGREFRISGECGETQVIALPHPSGASAWVHQHDNVLLLDSALRLLSREFTRLVGRRRVAA